MTRLLLAILGVAAVATIGDYIWYEIGVAHTWQAGVIHGAVLLGAVGAALGWSAGRVAAGLPIGIAAGVGGAAAYYAIAAVLGRRGGYFGPMIAAWMLCWVTLAVGEGRWIQRAKRPWGQVLTRGVIAAILGGLAFYAVSGTIWGRAPAGGRNYLVHFALWAIAWAPGLLAIALGGTQRRGER